MKRRRAGALGMFHHHRRRLVPPISYPSVREEKDGRDEAEPANRVADGGRDDRASGTVRARCLRRGARGAERQHDARLAHQYRAALARPAAA